MYKTFFETKQLAVAATEKIETKMDKVKCNNKENGIVKKESEKTCGLIFPF